MPILTTTGWYRPPKNLSKQSREIFVGYNNNNKIYLFEILRGSASTGLFCIQHKSTTTDLQNQQQTFFSFPLYITVFW